MLVVVPPPPRKSNRYLSSCSQQTCRVNATRTRWRAAKWSSWRASWRSARRSAKRNASRRTRSASRRWTWFRRRRRWVAPRRPPPQPPYTRPNQTILSRRRPPRYIPNQSSLNSSFFFRGEMEILSQRPEESSNSSSFGGLGIRRNDLGLFFCFRLSLSLLYIFFSSCFICFITIYIYIFVRYFCF